MNYKHDKSPIFFTTVTIMVRMLSHNIKALIFEICYIFCCNQFDFDHLPCFCFSK